MHLSKSQYIRGLQCHKALWLYRHRRDLMTEPDANRLAMFASGHEVGALAKSLFPGGTEIEFEFEIDQNRFAAMAEQTACLIDSGVDVIYEATFCSGDLLVMADILVRHGEQWNFYEVKSSTRVKPYHLNDAAFQWRVLSDQIPLGKAHVVHIDNRYQLMDGLTEQLDPQLLLKIVDVTDSVIHMQAALEQNLQSMQAMLQGDEPDVAIGMQCNNPFDCDFKAGCWQSVPRPSVFDLHQLSGERKFELFHQGKTQYQDLQSVPLSPAQTLQVDTALSGEAHIEPDRLGEFIRSASYPLHFLDFETLQNSIPKLSQQRPYQQIPFQYSLHILQHDGQLEHHQYLADEHADPRPALAQHLLQDMQTSGSILAFSQSTEIAAINTLANACPEQATDLRVMTPRFIDLLIPFRGLMYYHPDFNGSFSIKSILPAMFPGDEEADYQRLEVQDGRMAMSVYAGLAQIDDAAERDQIRESLLAYCRLDTLAMVKIWQRLASLVDSGN
jgi:hypothetical protein